MSSAEGTGESRTGVPGTPVSSGVEGADAVAVGTLGEGAGATAQPAISTAPKMTATVTRIDRTRASIHGDAGREMQVCT
jgi:hypothetical protein